MTFLSLSFFSAQMKAANSFDNNANRVIQDGLFGRVLEAEPY